jgi:type II secretory pathway component PulC
MDTSRKSSTGLPRPCLRIKRGFAAALALSALLLAWSERDRNVRQDLVTPTPHAPLSPARKPASQISVALSIDPTHVRRQDVFVDFSKLPQKDRPGRIAPYFEGEKRVGVLFTEILPGGLFSKLGISDGDIVQGCTEETLNSPFGALENGEASLGPISLTFCILRDGARTVHQVAIE